MKPPDLNQITQIAEETAAEWITDAIDFVEDLSAGYGLEKMPASHAILVAAFVMLKQREAHYEEQRFQNMNQNIEGKLPNEATA